LSVTAKLEIRNVISDCLGQQNFILSPRPSKSGNDLKRVSPPSHKTEAIFPTLVPEKHARMIISESSIWHVHGFLCVHAKAFNASEILSVGKQLTDYFAYLEVDEIISRLLKSNRHSSVYKALLQHAQKTKADLENEMREYDRWTKAERAQGLLDAARYLSKKGLDRYKQHYDYELLCEHIVETLKDSPRVFNGVFGHSDDESDLYDPIRKYLKREYSSAYQTDHLKREGWPDFFAYDKGGFGINLIAIDAKTQFKEYKRFLNQASMFMDYSDRVLLATTPGLVIEIGLKTREMGAYGEEMLSHELIRTNIGLLIVDMTSGTVSKQIDPKKHGSLNKEQQERCIKKIEYYFPKARGLW
jgi:hypothetical protein